MLPDRLRRLYLASVTLKVDAEQLASRHDFVVAVQSCHTVTLGKRRIVEGVFDKVIDSSLKRHNHLPDVNELRGALSDGVDAHKLAGILMEKKFQHSHFVPQDLPPCDFSVTRDANLVGNSLLDELSLVLPDHGDLGYGIDPVGDEMRAVLCGDIKSVTRGRAPLFHRR